MSDLQEIAALAADAPLDENGNVPMRRFAKVQRRADGDVLVIDRADGSALARATQPGATSRDEKKMNIKRINPKEFRALGYLQDANRRYFHPLGLALEVIVDDDGSEKFGGVWDCCDDPEGMAFADADWTAEKVDVAQAMQVDADRKMKAAVRLKNLGFVIQPLPGTAR